MAGRRLPEAREHTLAHYCTLFYTPTSVSLYRAGFGTRKYASLHSSIQTHQSHCVLLLCDQAMLLRGGCLSVRWFWL